VIRRIIFGLVVAAIVADSTWAVRSDRPHDAIYLLDTKVIDVIASGAVGYMGGNAYLSPGNDKKHTITESTLQAWQRFIERAGQGWSVQWNPITDTPHLITGRAMVLPGAKKLTGENIEAACLNFVAAQAELLKVEPSQLELAHKIRANGRWFVCFRQVNKGIPVLGSRVILTFTPDDELVMFGSDVHSDVAVATEPELDKKMAMQLAGADCRQTAGDDRVSEPQLCILPLYRPEGLEYLLCWKLNIFQPTVHKKWQYLIDAIDGKIISKRDVLVYGDVTGSIRGEYKPEFAHEPAQVAAFPYEHVSAQGPEVVIASWNFDHDPNWTTEGQWSFGRPTGGGGYLCNDPCSGYTGENVYGYNLNGDYEDEMPAYYLTTTPIDCSGCSNVHLKFMRWLGVESSRYDNASIEVSSDGLNWTTIWVNPEISVCDQQWVSVSYDISSVAAMQPTVYIRWVMGPTDIYVTYPGWNIDDVAVVTYLGGINTTQSQADGSYCVKLPWTPANITSELKGPFCDINYDCGSDARFEQPRAYPNDVVNFTWNNALYNSLDESSVYWHTNYVHDYYLAMDPSLAEASGFYPSGLNYPMPVTVQLGCPYGFCNAYWDGEGMAFGGADGFFCDSFGLYAEIVYHEYTHAVTSKIYDGVDFPYYMEPGAMNEAWSDYFGCLLSPSQSPLVGDGGVLFSEPNGFRTLANAYRRDTDWFNEVHIDSQMFSGALWEVRQVAENQMGVNTWDQMVHFTRYAHPMTFEDYLLAILVEDDIRYGDRNLTNGTPHGETIYTAFGNHGIGGLQYIPSSLLIDDRGGNADGKLQPGETAHLSLSLTNGWANATGIQATLTTDDPFLTILKGSAHFPEARSGDVVDNAADPFMVSLDISCPQTHTINFTLEVTANGPYRYSRMCLFGYAVAVNQLAYDDGQVDWYVAVLGEGAGMAVRMTPQSYPFSLTHVRVFPLEDSTITIKLWDDDGPRGIPGTVLGSMTASLTATEDWVDVDISSLAVSIDSGSFYVGWSQGQRPYPNGMDSDPPYYGRSWARFYDGSWVPFEHTGLLANLLVRVRHCVAGGPIENHRTKKRYCYIQQAINDAIPGDEIVVDPGIYPENINFKGKSITVRSIEPGNWATVEDTIINGCITAVNFASREDANSVLAGFTVTGANAGIYCSGASPTITHCIITGAGGAGIKSCNLSNPKITHCVICNNHGPGVELQTGPQTISLATITNCTIVANQQPGIVGGVPIITNSIIYNNASSIESLFPFVTYSNVQGGLPGIGNIDDEPFFADANNGDYHLKSQAGRWNTNEGQWTKDGVTSPCIDAGDPNSDWGGELWPHGKRINMGAFGGTPQASMSLSGEGNVADFNNDDVVNIKDLAILAEVWLVEDVLLAPDISRNGLVNLADLAHFAQYWFWTNNY